MLKLSGWVLYENKSLDVILQYNDHESVHSCKVIREGANKSPNIKMRLCKYLNLIN